MIVRVIDPDGGTAARRGETQPALGPDPPTGRGRRRTGEERLRAERLRRAWRQQGDPAHPSEPRLRAPGSSQSGRAGGAARSARVRCRADGRGQGKYLTCVISGDDARASGMGRLRGAYRRSGDIDMNFRTFAIGLPLAFGDRWRRTCDRSVERARGLLDRRWNRERLVFDGKQRNFHRLLCVGSGRDWKIIQSLDWQRHDSGRSGISDQLRQLVFNWILV